MFKLLPVFATVVLLQSVQLGFADMTAVSFRLENPTGPFIGRVSQISELKWSHLDKKMVVLTGIPGVGKSELAKKYAQEFKADGISSTIWINSETHTSIINDFKELARTQGLNAETQEIVAIIKLIFDHFSNRKTLFIFDNAEDSNILINNLSIWTGQSKATNILVTSRNEGWNAAKFKIIKLNPFTIEESKEYIKTSISQQISLPVDDASCEKLATFVNNLPSDLSEAVKHIINQNTINPSKPFTINDYIVSISSIPEPEVGIPAPEPAAEEVEKDIADKIEREVKRVGDQITNEAKRVAHSVRDEVRRVRKRIKKIFG